MSPVCRKARLVHSQNAICPLPRALNPAKNRSYCTPNSTLRGSLAPSLELRALGFRVQGLRESSIGFRAKAWDP